MKSHKQVQNQETAVVPYDPKNIYRIFLDRAQGKVSLVDILENDARFRTFEMNALYVHDEGVVYEPKAEKKADKEGFEKDPNSYRRYLTFLLKQYPDYAPSEAEVRELISKSVPTREKIKPSADHGVVYKPTDKKDDLPLSTIFLDKSVFEGEIRYNRFAKFLKKHPEYSPNDKFIEFIKLRSKR